VWPMVVVVVLEPDDRRDARAVCGPRPGRGRWTGGADDQGLDSVDEQLIARLAGKAREGGLALTGEGGLQHRPGPAHRPRPRLLHRVRRAPGSGGCPSLPNPGGRHAAAATRGLRLAQLARLLSVTVGCRAQLVPAGPAPAGAACGCRERGHVMRPARTHAGDRRAGRVGVAGWSRRRAGECGRRAGAGQVIGVGGACCSAR
jgi:hypothetical protein